MACDQNISERTSVHSWHHSEVPMVQTIHIFFFSFFLTTNLNIKHVSTKIHLNQTSSIQHFYVLNVHATFMNYLSLSLPLHSVLWFGRSFPFTLIFDGFNHMKNTKYTLHTYMVSWKHNFWENVAVVVEYNRIEDGINSNGKIIWTSFMLALSYAWIVRWTCSVCVFF